MSTDIGSNKLGYAARLQEVYKPRFRDYENKDLSEVYYGIRISICGGKLRSINKTT